MHVPLGGWQKQVGSHLSAKPPIAILVNNRSLIFVSVSKEKGFGLSILLFLDTWGPEIACMYPLSIFFQRASIIHGLSLPWIQLPLVLTWGSWQKDIDTHPAFRKEGCEPRLLAGTFLNSPSSYLLFIYVFLSTTFWDLTNYL